MRTRCAGWNPRCLMPLLSDHPGPLHVDLVDLISGYVARVLGREPRPGSPFVTEPMRCTVLLRHLYRGHCHIPVVCLPS